MATETVSAREQLAAFITCDDKGSMPLGRDAVPALLFNPEAPPTDLLPLAISRASRLRAHLDAWSCAEAGDLSKVAGALEPIVEEVELILMELQRRMHAADALSIANGG